MAENIFSVIAIVFGLLAAWLWYKSTMAKVFYDPSETKGVVDRINYFATPELQAKWNRWAAAATAISVLCQSIAMILAKVVHAALLCRCQ